MTACRYTVAVRSLCDFAARHGDLDRRFTPSPSAEQGLEGHKTVAARRGAAHRAEVSVRGEYRGLAVRGRADGFDAQRLVLEEVKTHKGDLERVPDNHRALHWAQLKVYGSLLCQQTGASGLTLALVYFEIASQHETRLEQHCTADELRSFFEGLCDRFLAWADAEVDHRIQRDAALVALGFPHTAFRPGQRKLAEAVFHAARLGRCLLAQAPTGIGKTIATIFPLLKAGPGQRLDKIFFLSAKTPGRALALESLATLTRGEPPTPLRVLELVARDKACEHPDKACHGDSCPLARGFYNRLPAARSAAAARPSLHRQTLREVALAHDVCPYYLGQEMARWSDVIVGDYNHYFDAGALLHGLTVANSWRVAVLVDEAHNLVDRARGMYSAGLHQTVLQALRRHCDASLKKPLDRLNRTWNAMNRAQSQCYAVHEQCPPKFAAALQSASSAIDEHCCEHPAESNAELLRFYFDTLVWRRLLDSFGEHSMVDVELDAAARPNSIASIRNITPAPFLESRWAAAHTVVLFSATLTPQPFYIDMLGLPGDTSWLDVEAPFGAEQLLVTVVPDISTRYRDRPRSLRPIACCIAAQFAAQPGNYLAFFSSFAYLQQVAEAFESLQTGIETWCQKPRMDEAQREAFLARFTDASAGIGFAVLGGAFGEGIDLPGRRLIGAFIATLGLPPVNAVNEEMRRRLDAMHGRGHDYVYLFPGIRKVVQAAGRVIRSASDVGRVFLIDDRYAQPRVAGLLPAGWRVLPSASPSSSGPSTIHSAGAVRPGAPSTGAVRRKSVVLSDGSLPPAPAGGVSSDAPTVAG